MEERKFDGTWNAERVLKTFLNYANEDGFLVDMTSYHCLISSTRSQKKMDEFRNIIKQSISAKPYYERMLAADSCINETGIILAFEKLFEFRKGIFALEHQWLGELLNSEFVV